jgi:hypothetical protein
MKIEELLTTTQAAAVIGITGGRVRQMARSGEIKSRLVLGQHLITPREAKRVAGLTHKIGRPRGSKNVVK